MIIPWQELDGDTEYGEQDVPLGVKVDAVREQLQQGKAVIVYSELHESVNIVMKDRFIEQS